MGKAFKILAIDGGGIKGLYSSTVIEHLEREFGAMHNHFHMICGTSTGGLIALALSLGKSAKDISNIYIENGQKIFPRITKLGGLLRQTLFWGKFSDAPLEQVLKGVFADAKVRDLKTYICIPSYSITDARPWVFKKDHGKMRRDNDTPLVKVALATSAAPTYFPVCEIDCYQDRQFVDGGVWANNPTLVGVIEALTYFVGPGKEFDSLEVLSVSSLNNTGGKPTGRRRHRSFIGWRNDLFETSLVGQSNFTNYVMERLAESSSIGITYCRIPSEPISAEQQNLVQLDCAKPKALKFIRGKGNDRGLLAAKDPKIENFFK